MAEHRVVMRTPKLLVRKTDIEFIIRGDGELMGRLLVSRGGIDYKPAHAQSTYAKSWEELHQFFTGEKWTPRGDVDEFDESDVEGAD
jgi:hypothetical protein